MMNVTNQIMLLEKKADELNSKAQDLRLMAEEKGFIVSLIMKTDKTNTIKQTEMSAEMVSAFVAGIQDSQRDRYALVDIYNKSLKKTVYKHPGIIKEGE
tara:strand:+ start:161 stop:457 length:297 start_codon:yes stop_codon:yes gene_type:complete